MYAFLNPPQMTTPRAGWATHPVTATIIGILAAALTVTLVERGGHALFGVGDPRSTTGISTPQYVAVFVAWILGAGIGALVAARWARSSPSFQVRSSARSYFWAPSPASPHSRILYG